MGRVTDCDGKPLAGALLDVWSGDGDGKYDVQLAAEPTMKARGRFRTDAEGRYWFWSIRPAYYPVPDDGPVGEMMRITDRSIYRPGHIHMMVSADGHVPVTTHIFVAGSPYIDQDAVFGKRDSLVVDFDAAPARQGGRRPGHEGPVPLGELRLPARADPGLTLDPLPIQEPAMKIGKATVPRTAICTSDEHTIVVRGRDLSKELIGKVSFVEHFFLLLVGRLPSAGEAAVLNATLVAIAEHGLVPSVQAARMTFAAAPDAMQGAVAAGVLGCGSVVLGSSETAGRMYGEIDAQVRGRRRRSTPPRSR